MTDIIDEAEAVSSRLELAAFLDRLAYSLENDPEDWDNDTLATFIRGWAGWVKGMDGYFLNRGEEVPTVPSWSLIAHMTLAARVYE